MNLICSDSALTAVHKVLTRTRSIAYQGCDSNTIGDVMDLAEYLVALLLNHERRTETEALLVFQQCLEEIESRFEGFEGLVAAFDAQETNLHRELRLTTVA